LADQDWFRNNSWSEAIERRFEEKLRRARQHKSQYLLIQAGTLARSEPEIALRLLERYFALDDKFGWAQAYCCQATAFIKLERIHDAITAYEHALAREAEFPHYKTNAYIELPFLVATRAVCEQFDRASELLEMHKSRLMFPVDRFQGYAAQALIANARSDAVLASDQAVQALNEARRGHSGFRYHAHLGLVGQPYDGLIEVLRSFVPAS
jgi:tetratricopeptide (TPR) repeat protein